MKLFCLDTNITIWGIQGTSRPSQAENVPKAQSLIRKIEQEKGKILIPTVVLGEFLLKIPAEHHIPIANEFDKSFILAPYDAKAANIFAQIWQSNRDRLATFNNTLQGTRVTLRADCMIVATAVARNADCIYTTDPHIMKFAEGFIPTSDLPNDPKQLPLFDQE